MSWATFVSMRRAVARGETTCEAVTSSFLCAIERSRHLNAFTYVDAEGALAVARKQDQLFVAGTAPPLAGLVLAVKDVLCVKDWPVTCASRMLTGFRSLYDATTVSRLKAQGAIIIGRTNCDEFAMGSSNENSHYGPVLNPRNEAYAPGGSSGGSAAAVAAGLCHAALGTDTGGSIRQPAALCGVVGLKPTYGRVSRYGLVAFASSFDAVGTLTRSVEDAACILQVMAGADPRDATSAPVQVEPMETSAFSVSGLRVGVPAEFFGEGLDDGIRHAIDVILDQLRAAGVAIQCVSMPHTRYGVATYYILAAAEASSNLGRYDGLRYGYRPKKGPRESTGLKELYVRARSQGFGREVKRRIMLGTYVLSAGYHDAYYAKAQRVRSLIRKDFERAFAEVDVLITPAAPMPGLKLGSMVHDPLQMYLSDIYTVTASLAGVPGLVVPIGEHASGLPVGLQVLGRPFDEARLLRLGGFVMQCAGGQRLNGILPRRSETRSEQDSS